MAEAIPAALAVGGSLLSAGGSIIKANAQAKELRAEAAQLDTQAGLDRATSQRQAIGDTRDATLLASRGLAVAAASGGGADDPTVVRLLAGIQGEGEYRAATDLYNGEETARGKEAQAAADRRGAKATKTAGWLGAAGTILSAGGSIGSRYIPTGKG